MCAEMKVAVVPAEVPASRREAVEKIVEHANLRPGLQVLDVACGSGELFPLYLARGVAGITGVDCSAEKLAQGEKKFTTPEIHMIRADIRACKFDHGFDRCLLVDALPEFKDLGQLIPRLADFVKPGGRLVLAHSAGKPEAIVSAEELAKRLAPWFVVDVCMEEEIYLVCAVRNDVPVPTAVPGTDKK